MNEPRIVIYYPYSGYPFLHDFVAFVVTKRASPITGALVDEVSQPFFADSCDEARQAARVYADAVNEAGHVTR